MNYYAIIVAGGSGNRMNNPLAKQFLLLNGKPVLMHTLEAFQQCSLNPEILLVLNVQQHAYWAELCHTHQCTVPHRVIEGGAQRYHSVKNGLNAIQGDGIVAIHDAVRPLITPELIEVSFKVAEEKGNAVVGINPTDSVRRIYEGGSEALNRDQVVLIQTPQTFNLELLRKAYQRPYRDEFTDDASVVEHAGFKINLVTGARENLKITWPEDMEIAAIWLNKNGSR